MKTRSGRNLNSSEKHEPIVQLSKTSKSNLIKKKKNAKQKATPALQFSDMNDDCIEEVFRRLPTVELCKFTVLNSRLKKIAERIFRRLYSNKILTFKPLETCATDSGVKTTKLFMKSFGRFIQQMQIVGTEKKSEKRMEANMLAAIGGYCGTNLQSVCLVKMDLNDETVTHLQNAIKNVPQLTLDCCRVADKNTDLYELLLNKCENLRTFNVIQCFWNHRSWLRHRYDKLRTVQVLRAIFHLDDVKEFFMANPNLREVWFNVRVPELTHRYDTEKLHRLLFIYGFEDSQYCLRFLRTYTQIVVKSMVLVKTIITEGKCDALAKMKDIRELKLISPWFVYEDMVNRLAIGLVNLASVFLAGQLFTFKIICEFLMKFPRLEFLYLYKTGYDAITQDQFAQLVEARKRSAAIATESYPLKIIVARSTPVYARTMWRKFKLNKNIEVITMKSAEFEANFIGSNQNIN